MIVGIFGDSFAAPSDLYSPSHSWTNLLSITYNYNVKNFAQTATSLFWSYKKLITHIDQVDTVVFVVTAPGRLYHPRMIPGTLWTVDRILNQPDAEKRGFNNEKLSLDNIEILKAAKSYYLNLSDHEFDMFVHTQLIKTIQELCQQKNKKLWLIPSVDQNISYQSTFLCALWQITQEEIRATFGDTMTRPETPARVNHMSAENNLILAGLVDNIITGKEITVTLDNFVFKKETNPELYWEL